MAAKKSTSLVKAPRVDITPVTPLAAGGGLEGAERTERETFSWNPAVISPDQQINPVKEMADARGRDTVQNDGYALGAVATHRDSIVGSQYRLNAQPDYVALGATEEWAEEFQQVAESRFNLLSDSPDCWFDASRMNTLTGMIRLAVGGFLMTGEVLATAEWLRASDRPFSTAIQMVSPSRLSNPDYLPDSRYLRRGVAKDLYGAPKGYHIRRAHPSEFYDTGILEWRYVPATLPWGRRQVIHIVEQLQPDQTRGVADMVSSLKEMRMTRKFRDITLQNAVVNASYAAAIESELPKEMIIGAMGGKGESDPIAAIGQYMTALQAYITGGGTVKVDGVKMPHLFPGTKLKMMPMGTPGGVGTNFEASLLRHTAAALGLSYEQFSRDYTNTNYSSARASMAETWKFMQSRKKIVADRMASMIYLLWLEEDLNAGNLPLPKGMTKDDFYLDKVKREALASCTWIGASRGQIDEMKETQAAILRINAGLSTIETESARLGDDYRKNFAQLSREKRLKEKLGLTFSSDAVKPGDNDQGNTINQSNKAAQEKDDE